MKAPIVYFDTSVFIGLIDNVKDRQPIAQNIVRYEAEQQGKIHTSIMTVNEFISRTYDLYHAESDIEDRVQQVVQSIRNVAEIHAYNQDIATHAARILSAYGRGKAPNPDPSFPNLKKFRWDSIHLATANLIKAQRVYAWDNAWHVVPSTEISGIGQIISPAVAPATNHQVTIFDMITDPDS